MSEKIHIERNTVQETLVIPLLARKICTEAFGDFFKDEKAVELINRLDYDFGDMKKHTESFVERFAALEVATRQKACALEIKNYLKAHPCAAVVNLGCGLDQTAESCDNGKCKIYNVDFADTIEIREQLIKKGERVTNVASDLKDLAWFDKIDGSEGAVFFGTGVFYYFTKDEIKKIFNGMAKHFPGGILIFDITGKTAANTAVKGWIKKAGIDGKFDIFYVGDVEKDINSWLKNAKATYRKYMTGYFDLKEKSISGIYRFVAKLADNLMKMKIIKIEFLQQK